MQFCQGQFQLEIQEVSYITTLGYKLFLCSQYFSALITLIKSVKKNKKNPGCVLCIFGGTYPPEFELILFRMEDAPSILIDWWGPHQRKPKSRCSKSWEINRSLGPKPLYELKKCIQNVRKIWIFLKKTLNSKVKVF